MTDDTPPTFPNIWKARDLGNGNIEIFQTTDDTERDPSNTDIELLTAPLDEDDNVLTLVDTQIETGGAHE